jgi:hypothetical protein
MGSLPPLFRREQASLPVRVVVDGGANVAHSTIHDRGCVEGQGWLGFVRWPGWRWVPLKNVERMESVDYSVIRPRWWLRDGEQWREQQRPPRSIWREVNLQPLNRSEGLS